MFLNGTHAIKEKVPIVEKKPLQLVLPYLGTVSLQTSTQLQKSIKGILNSCKLQVVFKSENKLFKNVHFNNLVPQILTWGMVYKFQCELCNKLYYGECVRHLGERIGISPLTSKRVQPRKDSTVCHPSVFVWMSLSHIVSCALWTYVIIFLLILCKSKEKL